MRKSYRHLRRTRNWRLPGASWESSSSPLRPSGGPVGLSSSHRGLILGHLGALVWPPEAS
eukprot:6264798-Pyramimonas_sp.AAC.1